MGVKTVEADVDQWVYRRTSAAARTPRRSAVCIGTEKATQAHFRPAAAST
ncbi:MAG: hypothetical protein WKH64_18650 [Chloroflexia bacterium]